MPAPPGPNGDGTHSTTALGFTDEVTLLDKENAPNASRSGVRVGSALDQSMSQVTGAGVKLAPLAMVGGRKTSGKSSNVKKKFNKLVQAINYAKTQNKRKGAKNVAKSETAMDKITDEWNAISRF